MKRISLVVLTVAFVVTAGCAGNSTRMYTGLTDAERQITEEDFMRLPIDERVRLQRGCFEDVENNYREGRASSAPANILKGAAALAMTITVPVAGAVASSEVMRGGYNSDVDALKDKQQAGRECYARYHVP